MEIEWDEAKRRDALSRHGVDFADVALIDFPSAMTTADNRRDYGEPRWVTYGMIGERLHVVCWTSRNGRMRIISFRKANDREQKIYAATS
ncbi:MAG: BrnT family toxin [Rhizobiaceae bacterium]|nr:BrnT family toxin [Rhizobiaceae bacterium]MCV0404731.1 BrnT family toxin [Rhizobiaceae bacterium]